jgi:iron(III) transport system ATP-binding protein
MLTVENLVKTFDGGKGSEPVYALRDVSLELEPQQVLTLLGPSGCGKTTTLRSIAGLEEPDEGKITIASRVIYDSGTATNVVANKRGLGMVFQSYAIWPNMNVFKNVAFPLTVLPRAQRPSRATIAERVERVLATVHLDGLADRPATDLSGGQQQRLALARALVLEPSLLLLDEPLSNLDVKLREEMLFELKRLQRDLGITTVYVTHDQTEALALSTKIAVMNHGKVEQVGRPREIYNEPRTKFVAGFIGKSNIVDGTIVGRAHAGAYEVETVEGRLAVASNLTLPQGKQVSVSIRPEHIELSEDPATAPDLGVWKGEVIARAFLGESVEHQVQLSQYRLLVVGSVTQSIPAGTQVTVRVQPELCGLIPEV